MEIAWEGDGVDETGKDSVTGKTLVKVDPRYFRPAAADFLLGDATKARKKLGWKPTVLFDELVKIMVREDLKEAEKDHLCSNAGFRTFNGFE